jgi:hypothetical protein
MRLSSQFPLSFSNLVCFWDFQEVSGSSRIAKGLRSYKLYEQNGKIERVENSVFGQYSARLKKGQWFNLPRAECPALNICGQSTEISIVAWLQRYRKLWPQCEAVAGMWNESESFRQYCLFLNLPIRKSRNQVCGHISSTGDPTPGYRYCMEAAIGATPVAYHIWQCVGMTYNGHQIKAYLNGKLDFRSGHNPYEYKQGIFCPTANGSDFTVGAVSRRGSMGNWFVGLLGGLVVYNRALTDDEMLQLAGH